MGGFYAVWADNGRGWGSMIGPQRGLGGCGGQWIEKRAILWFEHGGQAGLLSIRVAAAHWRANSAPEE